MIKYSWNYALLLAKGPSREALVPSPLYVGMEKGMITRFEEITRTPAEVQDCLISVLSDKVMNIPELGDQGLLFARPGFNVIGTANTRDKGVNEMSSALKRRFSFETVPASGRCGLGKADYSGRGEGYGSKRWESLCLWMRMPLPCWLPLTMSCRQGISAEGMRLKKPARCYEYPPRLSPSITRLS